MKHMSDTYQSSNVSTCKYKEAKCDLDMKLFSNKAKCTTQIKRTSALMVYSPILWPMMENFFNCRAVGGNFTDHQPGRFTVSSQNRVRFHLTQLLLWFLHRHK